MYIYEPISNIMPATGCYAVWDDGGKLIESPLLGWVLMSVTECRREGQRVKEENEIHGVLLIDGEVDTPKRDSNFYGYRSTGSTLDEMQRTYEEAREAIKR